MRHFRTGIREARVLLISFARFARGWYRKIRWLLTDNWIAENSVQGKSVLLIYDFMTQPFSIGDMITAQAASLAIARGNGCSAVDLAMVYRVDKPAIDAPDYRHIVAGEFYRHLEPMLSLLQINPLLRSVFIFDSRERLEQHITENGGRYVTWPSVSLYASGEYLFYHCMNDIFVDHFKKYGKPPYIESNQPNKIWARSFLEDMANGARIRISLQIRANPYNIERNSVMSAWEALFQRIEQLKLSVIFFVVCGISEIPKGWSVYKNVVLVKLKHTSLVQDLAIICSCDCHMGASSGPGMVAILGSKPYRLYSYDGDERRLRCLVNEGGRQRFSFSEANQYLVRRHEDADVLLDDVLEMTGTRK